MYVFVNQIEEQFIVPCLLCFQVLEVHEQMEKSLESDLESEELAEGEKALVREMCNVRIT